MQGSVNLSDTVMKLVILNSVIFFSPVCLIKMHSPFNILSIKLLLIKPSWFAGEMISVELVGIN